MSTSRHGLVPAEDCPCATCREINKINPNPILEDVAKYLREIYNKTTNVFVNENIRTRTNRVVGFHFQDALRKNRDYLEKRML